MNAKVSVDKAHLGFSPFSLFQESGGNSSFHSLQASAKKAMSHHFQFLVSYTLSKTLDDAGDSLGAFGFGGFGVPTLGQDIFNNQNDRRAQHGRSSFDVRNRFVVNYILQIPSPDVASSWLRKLTEGWSVSGVVTAQSGRPFSIFDFPAASIFGQPTFFRTASLVPGKTLKDAALGGSVNGRLNRFFNPSAFTSAPSVQAGDLIDGKIPRFRWGWDPFW